MYLRLTSADTTIITVRATYLQNWQQELYAICNNSMQICIKSSSSASTTDHLSLKHDCIQKLKQTLLTIKPSSGRGKTTTKKKRNYGECKRAFKSISLRDRKVILDYHHENLLQVHQIQDMLIPLVQSPFERPSLHNPQQSVLLLSAKANS